MKIQVFIFLVVLVPATGCTSDSIKTDKKFVVANKLMPKSPISIPANGSKLKDTLFITGRSAVSFWLDSAEMEKRRKKEGDDFSTGADDAAEYAARADSFLHKQNLPIVQADRSRYLKFLQSNDAFTFIKTDTLPLLHTLYFFDPNKKPYNADITLIEDEYKKFFH
jgi:hypothetical protein